MSIPWMFTGVEGERRSSCTCGSDNQPFSFPCIDQESVTLAPIHNSLGQFSVLRQVPQDSNDVVLLQLNVCLPPAAEFPWFSLISLVRLSFHCVSDSACVREVCTQAGGAPRCDHIFPEWERGWVLCLFGVGIKQIQYFIVSDVTCDILSECGQRGMIKDTKNKEGKQVMCLCKWKTSQAAAAFVERVIYTAITITVCKANKPHFIG